jgi:uncharacterized membrane protein YeaQ/YmgE (transglycosylase-associated protein family)
MDILDIAISAIIGVIVGWLASQLLKGSDFGLAGDIVLGVAGAVAGGWLLPYISTLDAILSSILNSCIGACVVLLVLRPFVKRA